MRETKARIKQEKDEGKKNKRKQTVIKSKLVTESQDDSDPDDDLAGVGELPMDPLPLNHDQLQPGQWVVVPYNLNSIKRLYVGQILTINLQDKTASIKYLEKKVESEKFVWPKRDDIDNIELKEIVRLLREPTFDRWGYLAFEDY